MYKRLYKVPIFGNKKVCGSFHIWSVLPDNTIERQIQVKTDISEWGQKDSLQQMIDLHPRALNNILNNFSL